MKSRLRAFALVGGLLVLGSSVGVVRAGDKKTPEQIKEEKKEKDLKKAKDDLEKELKSKKIDPAPAIAMLDKLATQIGLDVPPSKDLVHKILSKKIPWDQANANADDKLRNSVDPKTNKIDLKKFQNDFKKWISEWKPEKPEKK